MNCDAKATMTQARIIHRGVIILLLGWFSSFAAGTALVGERKNVALASEGGVAISDSDYGPHLVSLINNGKWIGPGDHPAANRWHAALGKPHPHWVWIRFRQPARIDRVVVHRAAIADYPVDFVGRYSRDGGFTFQPLFGVTNQPMTAEEFAVERTFAPAVTDNSRLRILRSSHRQYPNSAQLSEVEVFGKFTGERAREYELPAATPIKGSALRPSAARGVEIVQGNAEIEFRSKWLRLVVSKTAPRMTALCWDSLGEGRVNANLLKSSPDGGASLSFVPLFPETRPLTIGFLMAQDGNVVRYTLPLAGGVSARWEIRVSAKQFEISVAAAVAGNTLAREPLA